MSLARVVKRSLILISLISTTILFISCDSETTPTAFKDLPSGGTPVITAISPADSGLAGISEVTITGQNFSSDATKNIVYFDEFVAEILEVSETQLVVKAPNIVKDSVEIKAAVQGVPLFSETFLLDLKSATKIMYPFQDFEIPYAITTDNEENVIFNFVVSGISTGFSKILSSGVIEDFSDKGGESFYTDMRYGSNGKVYGTRNPAVRALFGSEQGGSPKAVVVSADQSVQLFSLAIDNNLNIWTGGSAGNIYRVTPDETDTKEFPSDLTIKSLRFFDGYLYAVATQDTVQAIWRISVLSADSIGEPEKYYDIATNLNGYTVNAITFSEDGKLFMGTSAEGNDPNTIVYLNSGKDLKQFYPGILSGPVLNFAWGEGVFLYYTRGKVGEDQLQSIIQVNTGMLGAPYFGRD